MNTAVYVFVRICIDHGDIPLGVHDGIDGLISGNIKELHWSDVSGLASQGGAFLGIKPTLPTGKFEEIVKQIKEFRINGFVFMGGFRAFEAGVQFIEQRNIYPELCIPLVVIPVSISNNVPGTEYSLGCDTSLNEITVICDQLRQSAQGTRDRVFVIEIRGGYCGYLSTMAGLASGSDVTYISEENFTVSNIQEDVQRMILKMNSGVKKGLVICNENCSTNLNSDFIHRLYSEEGKNNFSCRLNVLGHNQEGGSPSPFDRYYAAVIASKCYQWLVDQLEGNADCSNENQCDTCRSASLIGMISERYKFTPLVDLFDQADFEKRMPKSQWWLNLRPVLKILSHYTTLEDLSQLSEDSCHCED
ncbi:ATP-dependent 6-phosphofructokinase-like [Teleopsis dalmanni]|uniref:ATP-dependent 6-phosphofructokinase-like n=1 Tax=Teleopsis dalmanni TaxID=139649 RepID=UPI0018CEE9B9|nr:ATP-dependent 6-phosphofructokinase-like [Teleopsis dalmanni]